MDYIVFLVDATNSNCVDQLERSTRCVDALYFSGKACLLVTHGTFVTTLEFHCSVVDQQHAYAFPFETIEAIADKYDFSLLTGNLMVCVLCMV